MALTESKSDRLTHGALALFRKIDYLWPLSILEAVVCFYNVDLLEKAVFGVLTLEIQCSEVPVAIERLLYLVTAHPDYPGCTAIRCLAKVLLDKHSDCIHNDTMKLWLSGLDVAAKQQASVTQARLKLACQEKLQHSQELRKLIAGTEEMSTAKVLAADESDTRDEVARHQPRYNFRSRTNNRHSRN